MGCLGDGMAGGSLADLNYGRLTRSSASHAARWVARHGVASQPCPSRSWASVPFPSCKRSPAIPLVVLPQLEIKALAMHPNGYVADAGPGVEPCAERPGSAVIRGARKPGEAECCS